MRAPFDFSGLGAVVYKEVRYILREPSSLAMIILMPIMQLVIYGYAINLHVQHVPTGYFAADRGRFSDAIENVLARSKTFDVVQKASSEAALRRAMVAGRIRVAFMIPAGASADAEHGRPVNVKMLVDGSDASIAQAAYGAADAIASEFSAWLDPLGESPAVDIRTQTLFNPSLRTPNFLMPGLIALVMQNMTIVLTTLSIVIERDRGTLDQMRVSPIGSGAVVFGKILPYGALGLLDVLLVLTAMRNIFAVPVAGSLWLLLALSVAFLMTGLGIGLLFSTIARSQLQAMLLAIMFLIPSFLLSGVVFEVGLMPVPARVISYALPMTYFIEVLRGIIVRGAGFTDLWVPAVVTIAFGAGMLALASIRFAGKAS